MRRWPCGDCWLAAICLRFVLLFFASPPWQQASSWSNHCHLCGMPVLGAFALLGFLPVPPPRLPFFPVCLLPCWLRKAMVTCGVWLSSPVLGFLKQENANGDWQLDVVLSFISSPFSGHVLFFFFPLPFNQFLSPGPHHVESHLGVQSALRCAKKTSIYPVFGGNHGEMTQGDARACWTRVAGPVQGAKSTGPCPERGWLSLWRRRDSPG